MNRNSRAEAYGFRPGLDAHQALQKVQEITGDGYKYCIDFDLEKFFDTVNQIKLVQLLSDTINDGRVVPRSSTSTCVQE